MRWALLLALSAYLLQREGMRALVSAGLAQLQRWDEVHQGIPADYRGSLLAEAYRTYLGGRLQAMPFCRVGGPGAASLCRGEGRHRGLDVYACARVHACII